jgi:putative membrane protein
MIFTSASSTQTRLSFKENQLLKIYLIVFFITWLYTFLFTTDLANWWTENMLTILFLILMFSTYRKFKFSDLSYTMMFIFMMMHIYGAMYTYAENPGGYWLKDVFELERNPYDRIVHLGFGLLLSYPMRDYFKNWFNWPNWVCWVLPVEITMSLSGAYELIEWLVAAIFFPAQGPAYLGSQGDPWDAQKDMGLAIIGAIIVLVITALAKRIYRK